MYADDAYAGVYIINIYRFVAQSFCYMLIHYFKRTLGDSYTLTIVICDIINSLCSIIIAELPNGSAASNGDRQPVAKRWVKKEKMRPSSNSAPELSVSTSIIILKLKFE